MTKYFFTGDEHFYHNNIIKYCNRPFKSVEEMNNIIIAKHNEKVSPDDIVIHCGDFALNSNTEEVLEIQKRLMGHHQYIKGSHDKWNPNLPYILELKISKEIFVVACHYAMRTWPKSHYGSYLAYGHSHGRLPTFPNSWDVGVDNNNFYPVELKDFIKKCKMIGGEKHEE